MVLAYTSTAALLNGLSPVEVYFQFRKHNASTRSIPGSLRLYGLLKDQLCKMAEKPVLPGTPGIPTGRLPNQKHLQGTPSYFTSRVGTLGLPLVPGHIKVGTRLLRLGMKLLVLVHSAQ